MEGKEGKEESEKGEEGKRGEKGERERSGSLRTWAAWIVRARSCSGPP